MPIKIVMRGKPYIDKKVRWTSPLERIFTYSVNLEAVDIAFTGKLEEYDVNITDNRVTGVKAQPGEARLEVVAIAEFREQQVKQITGVCKLTW